MERVNSLMGKIKEIFTIPFPMRGNKDLELRRYVSQLEGKTPETDGKWAKTLRREFYNEEYFIVE